MPSETALELDPEAVGYTRGQPVHFAGFPGVWEPGRPIAVNELGFASADDALEQAEGLGLPLVEASVEHGSAPMPARVNHMANEEQARAVGLAQERDWPPKTHATVDALAEAAGVEWPRQKMTVAEKTDFLDAYTAGVTDEADETPTDDEEGGG